MKRSTNYIRKVFFLFFCHLIIFSCNANPRLSIIIPVYPNQNISLYLQDLTQQTFFKEVEILLISNPIPNEEKEILSYFTTSFPNIHYFTSEADCYESCLYNYAIKQATAPFLAIFNNGDYRDATLLDLQLQALEKYNDIDLIYSDFMMVYENHGFKDGGGKWYFVQLDEFRNNLLYSNCIGTHYIWRKSLHQKYGYLADSFKYQFFWEFWNRCAANGAQFCRFPGCAGNYFFNYFKPRKLFFSEEDFEQNYQEERYIKDTYNAMWDIRYDYPEKPFVIVIASYNNKHWYKKNLDSVLCQNYTNYRAIYIDDRSSDQTGQLVQEYLQNSPKGTRIDLLNNAIRCGATANIYTAIHTCQKHEIVIILDGDDSLAHPNVLNHLNAIYQDPNVWLTYGQFQWFPNNVKGFAQPLPDEVHEKNSIRQYGWVTSHLRTFYAGLYQKIKKEDLMYNNQFYPMAGDLAIMFPLVEMASTHCKFVNETLCIYNSANSLNDEKVDGMLQLNLGTEIRKREVYAPINFL